MFCGLGPLVVDISAIYPHGLSIVISGHCISDAYLPPRAARRCHSLRRRRGLLRSCQHVAVLHGFRALFPVFMMIIATGFVLGLVLFFLLMLTGVMAPMEMANV